MAKQQVKAVKKNTWGVFGLEFIGSIIFLIVAFTVTAYSAATLWEPLLYAAAVVGATALFFTSFANFGASGRSVASFAMTTTLITGFVLVALTFGGSAMYLLMTLVGFVLAFIGSGIAHFE